MKGKGGGKNNPAWIRQQGSKKRLRKKTRPHSNNIPLQKKKSRGEQKKRIEVSEPQENGPAWSKGGIEAAKRGSVYFKEEDKLVCKTS